MLCSPRRHCQVPVRPDGQDRPYQSFLATTKRWTSTFCVPPGANYIAMINAIAAAQNSQNPRTENLARQADKNGSYMQMEDFLQLLTSQISNQGPFGTDEGHRIHFPNGKHCFFGANAAVHPRLRELCGFPKRHGSQAYLGRMVSISEQGSKFPVWSSQSRNPRTARFRSLFPVRITIPKASPASVCLTTTKK